MLLSDPTDPKLTVYNFYLFSKYVYDGVLMLLKFIFIK